MSLPMSAEGTSKREKKESMSWEAVSVEVR